MKCLPTNKRYFKILYHPDFFGDPGEENLYIPIDKNGGVIEDPNRNSKSGHPGIHFTDIKNIGYYYTYGDHFVEIFPIPGIKVKSCKDDDGKGWYTPKVRYGPVQRMKVKDMCWFIANGADVTMNNGRLMYNTLTMLSEHPTNIWVRKMFQAMMVQLSNNSKTPSDFEVCWRYAGSVLGDAIYFDMCEILKNSQYNILMQDGEFRFIDMLYDLEPTSKKIPYFKDCIRQLLLRIRVEYPVEYSYSNIASKFSKYESYVKEMKDVDGFIRLLPVQYGPFDSFREKRRCMID